MPPTISPQEFVAKWSGIQQKETAISQSHFLDICALVGHSPPIEYDPSGKNFSFEAQTVKPDGQKGFADVFFRDHFIWEYKGPHKDLDRAYRQLQRYREALDNPPLLITSDIHTIEIHTNFNNYPTRKHIITFDDILTDSGMEKLRWAFFEPGKLRPDRTQVQITKATADTFVAVADEMKRHRKITGETYTPEQLAHFLVRLLFCLFAEDMGLLPKDLFTEIVRTQGRQYDDLQTVIRNLFDKMRAGGTFGLWRIRHFDGTLFDDDFVPNIPHDLGMAMLQAAEQDWSQVEPSIFGTLFERIIDEEKRAQLGAQYTGEDDIMLIVKPVLMEPLEKKWDEVRRQADRILRQPDQDGTHIDQAYQLLADFSAEISAIRVLDPASGSGNFLYISLRELLNLQKKVIAYAARKGLPVIELTVSPEQLYGIEINIYAHQLAQITSWIGYLQWRNENGFGEMDDPILRPLHNIKRMDAILAYDADGNPVEPEWPEVDVIVGNPPFLGDRKMRGELGDKYVDDLRNYYSGRIPGGADLVCYWFERANKAIKNDKAVRVGLIATNSIRGGANRQVLKRVKDSGDIFMAWGDRSWILDGAAVRVSIIGFDNGIEGNKALDGRNVKHINSDLTSEIDLSSTIKLNENSALSFIGTQKSGPFDISKQVAHKMLENQNLSGKENSDVVKPWINATDITRRPRKMWVIDFGPNLTLEQSKLYQLPFDYVLQNVKPVRDKVRRKSHRIKWWLFGDTRPGMREKIAPLSRFIVSPMVSKHRVFSWMAKEVIAENLLVAIARDDDYFFGLLHSRLHEKWALRTGTSLEDRPRYTPTSTFETFPFPWPPGQEPSEQENERVAEIGYWARELVAWRDAWLNPPPPQINVIDVAYEKMLKRRTLTNLYNGLVYYRETVRQRELFDPAQFNKVTRKSVTRSQIQELDDIHRALDEAVLDAFGWPHNISDEEILERLLALNLERAAAQEG